MILMRMESASQASSVYSVYLQSQQCPGFVKGSVKTEQMGASSSTFVRVLTLTLYTFCWCHWSLFPLVIYLKLPFLWLKCSHCLRKSCYLPGIFFELLPGNIPVLFSCPCPALLPVLFLLGFSTWHSYSPSLAFVCCSWKVCFEMKTAGVC